MNQSANDERFDYFYNLRAAAVISIIVLHGFMIYSAQSKAGMFTVDFDLNWFFASIASLIEVPVFFVILFVAGYFAFPTILQQSNRGFLLDKLKRKGLPWLVGVLLFTPPAAYFFALSTDTQIPFSLFLENHFWGEYYQQSVYWLLVVLIILSGCVSILYTASESFRSMYIKYREPSWSFIAGFIAVMSFGFFIINLSVPVDDWRHFGYLIMVQPVRIPLYIGYFFLGIYAFKNGWFRRTGYVPELQIWLPLTVISAAAYLAARIALHYEAGLQFAVTGVTAVTFNMFCYATIISSIAVFRKYINKRTLFWSSHAKNAYGMYCLHPLVLYALALYTLQSNIPGTLIIPAIVIASWLLVWMISEVVLTRAPALRDIFLPHQ